MTRDELPERIKILLANYENGDGTSGIKTELLDLAKEHPELLIDQSGKNLRPSDPEWYIYNPMLEGQEPPPKAKPKSIFGRKKDKK